MPGLRRQLRLLTLYAGFTYPFACVPFLYFHFRDHGVSIDQYTWLIATYYLSMVAMEVPTGMLADHRGRRLTLVLGPAVLAVGFAVFWLGETFAVFCVGQAVLGLGHSLLSGPPSALLYDSLAAAGKAHDFLRAESRIHAVRLAGTGAAFLAGGVLAALTGIVPTIVLTVLLALVAAAAALFLREPPHRPQATDEVRRHILVHAATDLRRPGMPWIAGYFVLVFFLLRYCFHTYQPFLEAAGEEGPLLVGTLYFALNMVAAPCSRLVPLVRDRLGLTALLWLLPLSMSLSLLAMGWAIGTLGLGAVGIALFFAHQLPFGMHWALISDLVNQRIGSHARTTSLSILSFVGRLCFAALFPVIGALHAAAGIADTYLVIGLATTLLAVLYLLPASVLSRPAGGGGS